MSNRLDNLNLAKSDPGQIIKHIEAAPGNYLEAWAAAQEIIVPAHYLKLQKILLVGMGGSGIASEAIKTLLDDSRLNIEILHSSKLPGYVDNQTLVIASSYSGDTIEVIDAFVGAYQRQAKLFAITSGGKLADLAQKYDAPRFVFNYSSPARMALPYLLAPLLAIFSKLGHLRLPHNFNSICDELKTSAGEYAPDRSASGNLAKNIALLLYDKLPLIFSSPLLASAGLRLKAQLNENAKQLALTDVFPELCHNTIEALSGTRIPSEIVLFQSQFEDKRNILLQAAAMRVLEKRHVSCRKIDLPRFTDQLAELLATFLLSDYISYYLALLNQVDPAATDNIALYKSKI